MYKNIPASKEFDPGGFKELVRECEAISRVTQFGVHTVATQITMPADVQSGCMNIEEGYRQSVTR